MCSLSTPVQRQLVDTGTGASNNDTQRLVSVWSFPAPETMSRRPWCEREMGEMGSTEKPAQFAAGASYDSVPEEVVAATKRAVLDAMAATIAGRQRDNNGAA
jgi:hypothetical protein